MIIAKFTEPELEHFRKTCNFVGDEIFVFEFRSKGIQLKQIAEALDIPVDKVKKISRKVNKKIIKNI